MLTIKNTYNCLGHKCKCKEDCQRYNPILRDAGDFSLVVNWRYCQLFISIKEKSI